MDITIEIGLHMDGTWCQLQGMKECSLVLEWCGLMVNERDDIAQNIYEMSIHNASLKKANEDTPFVMKDYISWAIREGKDSVVFNSITESEYDHAREFLYKAANIDSAAKVTY